jgi:hypothetical protein
MENSDLKLLRLSNVYLLQVNDEVKMEIKIELKIELRINEMMIKKNLIMMKLWNEEIKNCIKLRNLQV